MNKSKNDVNKDDYSVDLLLPNQEEVEFKFYSNDKDYLQNKDQI